MDNTTRFNQRFSHFKKAYKNLNEVAQMQNREFSDLEKEGIMQRFEVLIELSWKVTKDFLEQEGYMPKSPKETIRQAFSYGLIKDCEKWLEALDRRNVTSHTYDSDGLKDNVEYILKEFFFLVKNLYDNLEKKL